MSKPEKLKAPAKMPISCKAVSLFKLEGTDFLAVAYELTIEDGVVVSTRRLNSPDMPASAVGRASASLWSQYREQKTEG